MASRANTFGERLRHRREKDGYSRRELAEGSGLSEGAIRDYELGKRSPTFEAVCRLAVALRTNTDAFANVMDTSGAYKLAPHPPDVPTTIMTFGKHRGRHIETVPSEYLRWILREEPTLLQPGQREEIQRLLKERDVAEETFKAAEMRHVAANKKPNQPSAKPVAPQRRPRTEDDEVVDRLRREKLERRPTVPDPEVFG